MRTTIVRFFEGCKGNADRLATCLLEHVDYVHDVDPSTGAQHGLEYTDKPRPRHFYNEVFTHNVATRILYNEYGRDFQSGSCKERMCRILSTVILGNPCVFAGYGINTYSWDEGRNNAVKRDSSTWVLGNTSSKATCGGERDARHDSD